MPFGWFGESALGMSPPRPTPMHRTSGSRPGALWVYQPQSSALPQKRPPPSRVLEALVGVGCARHLKGAEWRGAGGGEENTTQKLPPLDSLLQSEQTVGELGEPLSLHLQLYLLRCSMTGPEHGTRAPVVPNRNEGATGCLGLWKVELALQSYQMSACGAIIGASGIYSPTHYITSKWKTPS